MVERFNGVARIVSIGRVAPKILLLMEEKTRDFAFCLFLALLFFIAFSLNSLNFIFFTSFPAKNQKNDTIPKRCPRGKC
ncbi:MAG: hypothetical protein Q4A17_06080 [Thermoguttaceae bacterium]|nr:hypothetical protein [Thermoguttaceae bacterium]